MNSATVTLPTSLQALADVLTAAGYPVVEPQTDGRIHRHNPADRRHGSKPLWYVAHRLASGHITAAYGDWREGVTRHWQSWSTDHSTAGDLARLAAEARQIRRRVNRQRQQARRAAGRQARLLWPRLALTGTSPYLTRKQVPALGIRFWHQTLAVPLWGPQGLAGLHWIWPDGRKRFSRGIDLRGAYHAIGRRREGYPLYLTEGYATAATLHLATGAPVAACLSAANLRPVAVRLRARYPRQPLIIAADHDQWPDKNGRIWATGQQYAEAAARAVAGQVVLPDFSGLDCRHRPTDFNDLALLAGLDTVHEQLRRVKNREGLHPGSAF